MVTDFSPPRPLPLVSVLIPSFNHESYIIECLESVIADGYPNIELIVIDDGSSDRTYEKAAEWISQHLRYFQGGAQCRTQENKGLVTTLNLLVAEAKGLYFVLVAGDDQLLLGGIASRLDYLLQHKEYLAVFGDAQAIDENGNLIFSSVIQDKFRGNKRALSDPRFRTIELILNWCVPGPVFMADRRVTEIVGEYSEKFLIEDRDYYLRLLAFGRLGFLDKPVAAYRLHSEAMTGTRARQRIIGASVAEIDRARASLFKGMHALALTLNWRANSARLTTTRFPKKALRLIEVFLSKLLAKVFLATCRSLSAREPLGD